MQTDRDRLEAAGLEPMRLNAVDRCAGWLTEAGDLIDLCQNCTRRSADKTRPPINPEVLITEAGWMCMDRRSDGVVSHELDAERLAADVQSQGLGGVCVITGGKA